MKQEKDPALLGDAKEAELLFCVFKSRKGTADSAS